MEAIEDLTETLIAAKRNDPTAKGRLEELITNNYAETVKALVAEIINYKKPSESRFMANEFFKNTLNDETPQRQNQLHIQWIYLDPKIRQTIKDILLDTLMRGNRDVDIELFVSEAASEVACVELSYEEWPNFVQSITDMIKSSDTPKEKKRICLACLGSTCARIAKVQRMLTDNVTDLPDETVNAILNTMKQIIQADSSEDLWYDATDALIKSLDLFQNSIDIANQLHFVIQFVQSKATESSDAFYRENALVLLINFVLLHYDKLHNYMLQINQITIDRIQNDSDKYVKETAIELWLNVAEMEQKNLLQEESLHTEEGQPLNRRSCNKYTDSVAPTLIPVLLQYLLEQSEHFDRLAGSVLYCLQEFSACIKDQIVPIVAPFVRKYITSDNWRMRDAAINAFTVIMEGPSTVVLAMHVQQNFSVLMDSLNDPNVQVRNSATKCIHIICKNHLQAVQMEQVHGMLPGLIQKLSESTSLASFASSAIFYIGTTLKPSDIPETNVLSAHMLPLLKALLQAADRGDASECYLRHNALNAVDAIIAASAPDSLPTLQELVPVIVTKVQAVFKILTLNTDERDNSKDTIGLLADLLTELFQRLETSAAVAHSDSAMQVILQILKINNAICQEKAFTAVGVIATSLKADFSKYLQTFMPFLMNALKNHQEHELYIVSVDVVMGLCDSVGGAIHPYCDDIMSSLTACLEDDAAHRDTKYVVLSCIGCIATAVGCAFEPYLQRSCMLLMGAAQTPIEPNNDDLVKFVNKLRHSVLRSYYGIIIGLVDGQVLQMFVPYVNPVMQFLHYLSLSESCKDDLCLQEAVRLVGNIAKQMGSDLTIRKQITLPYILQLIQEAKNSQNEKTNEIANLTRQVIDIMVTQPEHDNKK